ncbi:unnamed protein product [Fraxinus pennsylvanica]|uniref:Uncharacterized protein n=1 Tax=Fraxinus pennsylvanica TaxID=56036 RepID=A0AAD2DQV8_9LAMI|nr:unnamed protein product [Fraxinus pennsylvanica]
MPLIPSLAHLIPSLALRRSPAIRIQFTADESHRLIHTAIPSLPLSRSSHPWSSISRNTRHRQLQPSIDSYRIDYWDSSSSLLRGNYGLYRMESGRKGPALEFLVESGKNDYNWLKTPPMKPLFPFLLPVFDLLLVYILFLFMYISKLTWNMSL